MISNFQMTKKMGEGEGGFTGRAGLTVLYGVYTHVIVHVY